MELAGGRHPSSSNLDALHRTGLRLRVRDLGPVASADIAIRPLTLLMGHPNTGKSVVLKALYAALKAADRFTPDAIEPVTEQEISAAPPVLASPRDSGRLYEAPLQDLPACARTRIIQWVADGLGDGTEALDGALCGYLDVDRLAEMRRWDATNSQPEVELLHDAREPIGERSIAARPDLAALAGPQPFLWATTRAAASSGPNGLSGLSRHLARDACRRYLELCSAGGTAHYLPEGRAGLIRVWDSLSNGDGPHAPRGQLPGVVGDFMSAMARCQQPLSADVDHTPRCADSTTRRRLEAAAAEDMLRQAMGGDVRPQPASRHGCVAFESDDGRRASLVHAGSAVCELASLTLWAAKLLRQGDTLIIEEPEEGLHPSSVRRTAVALVRLANAGATVVCSTHSSVLVNEVSNCVLRHTVGQRTSGEPPAGDRLAAGMVSAYRFEHNSLCGGVRTTALRVDPEIGIPEDITPPVVRSVSRDTQQLLASLT